MMPKLTTMKGKTTTGERLTRMTTDGWEGEHFRPHREQTKVSHWAGWTEGEGKRKGKLVRDQTQTQVVVVGWVPTRRRRPLKLTRLEEEEEVAPVLRPLMATAPELIGSEHWLSSPPLHSQR